MDIKEISKYKINVIKEDTFFYNSNLSSAEKVRELFLKLFGNVINYQENVVVFGLNNSLDLAAILHISSGGITSSIVDIRIIFTGLLLTGCTGFIMAHNHPSGILKPSESDLIICKKLKEAGELLDIRQYDNLIITETKTYSLIYDQNKTCSLINDQDYE